jgi:hypothetical protein
VPKQHARLLVFCIPSFFTTTKRESLRKTTAAPLPVKTKTTSKMVVETELRVPFFHSTVLEHCII